MIFSQGHLKAGLNSVRSAKLRSFWTMLGVIIGVAAVITVIGIGDGVKKQIAGQIHSLGNNFITIRPQSLQTGSITANQAGLLSGLSLSGPLTVNDISTVTTTRGVSQSAPLTLTSGTVRSGQVVYRDGDVIGTTPDLPSLINQSLATGTFLNSQNYGDHVAVLGQNAAISLFSNPQPLGHSFTFHGQTFVVIGIFNQFNTTPLSGQVDFNNAIFIPNNVAESLTNNTAPTYEMFARAATVSQTKAVASRIKKRLDAEHGGQSGLAVLVGNQNLAVNDSILSLLTKLVAGVAAISLLVGGIGIMNVMLVSVAERTHEIGIRKAVGATDMQILSQFMIEATVLSLSGGVIGVILAYIIDLVLHATTDLQPNISWQVVAEITLITLFIGIVFGSVPALKAARRNPIDALRTE
jgi:ABC-type antimicrobial peptide transport system permease subunit